MTPAMDELRRRMDYCVSHALLIARGFVRRTDDLVPVGGAERLPAAVEAYLWGGDTMEEGEEQEEVVDQGTHQHELVRVWSRVDARRAVLFAYLRALLLCGRSDGHHPDSGTADELRREARRRCAAMSDDDWQARIPAALRALPGHSSAAAYADLLGRQEEVLDEAVLYLLPPHRVALFVVRHVVGGQARGVMDDPTRCQLSVIALDPTQAPQCAALIYHQHHTDTNTHHYEAVVHHTYGEDGWMSLLDVHTGVGRSLVRRWGTGQGADVQGEEKQREKKEGEERTARASIRAEDVDMGGVDHDASPALRRTSRCAAASPQGVRRPPGGQPRPTPTPPLQPRLAPSPSSLPLLPHGMRLRSSTLSAAESSAAACPAGSVDAPESKEASSSRGRPAASTVSNPSPSLSSSSTFSSSSSVAVSSHPSALFFSREQWDQDLLAFPQRQYTNFPLDLRPSPSDPSRGLGVYALVPIPQRWLVLEYHGELLSPAATLRRIARYLTRQPCPGSYVFEFRWKGGVWARDATEVVGDDAEERVWGYGRYVNHSRGHCNLRGRVLAVAAVPRLCFFSTRRIHAGEELLVDYGDRSRDSTAAHPWLQE